MESPALVSEFMSFTGADTDIALQYLKANNWDLNNAVQLFLTAGALSTEGTASSASAPNEPVVNLPKEADVRAPDPVKRQRLIEPNVGHGAGRILHHTMRNFRQEAASSAFSRNSGAGGPVRAPVLNTKQQGLAELFRPPTEIMFSGSFQEARHTAKGSGRWLIASVLASSEFDSHRLNRDTWKNESLQEIVRSNFVFWQKDIQNEDAQRFCNNYRISPQEQLPFTGVIDARTGGLSSSFSGFKEAAEVIDILMNVPTLGQGATPAAAADAGAAAAAVAASSDQSFRATEDDEALQQALQMSLMESEGSSGGSSDGGKKAAASLLPPPPPSAQSSSTSSSTAAVVTVDDEEDEDDEYMYEYESDGDGMEFGEMEEEGGDEEEELKGAGGVEESKQSSEKPQPDVRTMVQAAAVMAVSGDVTDVTDDGNAVGASMGSDKTPSTANGGDGAAAEPHLLVGEKKYVVQEEPPAGVAGVVRIQFRLVSGARIVRRFWATEQVGVLFEYVKLQVPGQKTVFDLRIPFPSTSLIKSQEQTLQEAQLNNVALIMISLGDD